MPGDTGLTVISAGRHSNWASIAGQISGHDRRGSPAGSRAVITSDVIRPTGHGVWLARAAVGPS